MQTKVNTFHTFGCPVYALDRGLASCKKIPKWDPRCILGLYLGNSPRHAGSVSQVLNLDTDRVSPQFHMIHNEFFETIALNDKIHTNWKRLAGFAPVQSTVPSTPSITPPLPILLLGSDPPPVTHHDPEEYMPPTDTNMEPPKEPLLKPLDALPP